MTDNPTHAAGTIELLHTLLKETEIRARQLQDDRRDQTADLRNLMEAVRVYQDYTNTFAEMACPDVAGRLGTAMGKCHRWLLPDQLDWARSTTKPVPHPTGDDND